MIWNGGRVMDWRTSRKVLSMHLLTLFPFQVRFEPLPQCTRKSDDDRFKIAQKYCKGRSTKDLDRLPGCKQPFISSSIPLPLEQLIWVRHHSHQTNAARWQLSGVILKISVPQAHWEGERGLSPLHLATFLPDGGKTALKLVQTCNPGPEAWFTTAAGMSGPSALLGGDFWGGGANQFETKP